MCDLPFELDTIEAIQEAGDSKALAIAIISRVAPFVLYVFCAIFEYYAYDAVDSRLDISCIEFYEISDAASLYLILAYLPIIPDAVFAIVGPISILMLYNNPYGVFYNGSVGILCFTNGLLFHIHMTFCGNVEQDKMVIGPLLQYLCGVLHIGNAIINHISFIYLDKEGELYFGRLEDFLDDLRD